MNAQLQPHRPPLAALVYRANKGCRQYAFGTVDALAAWATRHPYKNEQLRVMAVKDGKYVGDRWMPAVEAAGFARKLGAGDTPTEGHNVEFSAPS